jgi:hypothetical protein
MDHISNFCLNSEDPEASWVACKKKDFRNIDIFTLSYLESVANCEGQRMTNKDIKDADKVKSIRYSSYNLESLMVKFS